MNFHQNRKSYGWDSSESKRKSLKPTPLPHLLLWFSSLQINFHCITCGQRYMKYRAMIIVATTYAIVLFFFSRPFHENFKFLKNCPYDFHKILHSHSTPEGASACAKASKSYGWDVRNIAKISPKMAKKSDFSIFFGFFFTWMYAEKKRNTFRLV